MIRKAVEMVERTLSYSLGREGHSAQQGWETFKFTVSMERSGRQAVNRRSEAFAVVSVELSDAERIFDMLADGAVEPCDLRYVLDDLLVEMMYNAQNQELVAAINHARSA